MRSPLISVEALGGIWVWVVPAGKVVINNRLLGWHVRAELFKSD